MATFLGVHDMGSEQPEENMTGSWEAYKAACTKLGLNANHAYINASKGRAYCLTDAVSADEVQKAHDEAGVPINEIIEVKEIS